MRAAALLIIAFMLAGCAARHNGHDGMDGAGVAAVLRQQFNADR